MSTTATDVNQAASDAGGTEWDPIFDEVGLPKDVNNIYTQTVAAMLNAAEIVNLRHRVRIFGKAQPLSFLIAFFSSKLLSN